jgi:hypothetical protein
MNKLLIVWKKNIKPKRLSIYFVMINKNNLQKHTVFILINKINVKRKFSIREKSNSSKTNKESAKELLKNIGRL